MGLRITQDTLTPGLKASPKKFDAVVRTTMQAARADVQSSARSGAPWTDQTSNARQGLMARSGKAGNLYYIDLYHSVPYGIWLEVRWSGRYQIIAPTIQSHGPRVIAMLNNILGRL